MANVNTLTAVIPQILAQGLMALRELAIMPRLVNSDYSREAAQKGATIDVPIASAITAVQVSPSYVAPDDAGVVPTTVQVPLDQWYEAPFFLSDKDIAEAFDGFMPLQVGEAIKALANNVDSYLLAFYKGFYGAVGTAGTAPFASDIQDAVDARKILFEQLCPSGDRRAVLDPSAEANALMNRAFQDQSWRGDGAGIIEGQIGRKLGFDWFIDQNIGLHTPNAVGAGAMTVNGAHTAGDLTISIAKGAGANWDALEGDIVTFAGFTQQYVVTADTTIVQGTNTDLPIYPALQADLVGSEAVTVLAEHTPNMAFHRDAIAFATRQLEVPGDGLGSLLQAATDDVSGLTLRLEVGRQHKRTRWSFDILYGGLCVRPELGCRILG